MNETEKAKELVQDQLDDRSNLDIARANLSKKSGIFKRVFLTEDGSRVLEMLEQEFEQVALFNTDTNKTNYNLGSRDLLVYIKQLIKYETE